MGISTQARMADNVHSVVPPRQQQQLRLAASLGDHQAIDNITDELVRLGLCRPRRADEWQTQAERARAAAKLRGV